MGVGRVQGPSAAVAGPEDEPERESERRPDSESDSQLQGERGGQPGDELAPGAAPATRRRLVTLAEVVAGVLVVAAVMWPVTAHPGDQLAGSIDAPYHAWLGWRLAELWGHGHLFTWVIPDAVAPIGLDLRLIDGLLPGGVTAFFDLVTQGNLFLSYNLALATGIGLDLWAGRRLAQVLSSRRWVWYLCGVAFATAPALAGSAQAHIAFVYAFTLPLLLREAILMARGEVEVRVGRLVALFVVAYLCSAYHLVFGAITFALVLALWPRSAIWAKVALLRLGAVLLATLVLLSPFIAARISYERDERAAGSPDVTRVTESLAFSADALGAITPPDSLWIDTPMPRADLGVQLYAPLRPAFVGYALLAGLVLLVFSKRPARRPLLLTALALWVLSLGPALHVAGSVVGGSGSDASWFMPYRWLQALPGLGALRAPTRASYALAAVLTAALAVGLDALLDRIDRGRGGAAHGAPSSPGAPPRSTRAIAEALVAGVAVVLVALSVTAPMPTSDLAISSETRHRLEQIGQTSPDDLGHDGVLIVPWGCRLDDPRVLALQSIHRQPNIGCNPPPTATRWFSGIDAWASSRELAALRCDPSHIDRRAVPFGDDVRWDEGSVERLRQDLGVRYVIIQKDMLAQPFAQLPAPGAPCASVTDAVARMALRYPHTTDGSWVVIDLARPVPDPCGVSCSRSTRIGSPGEGQPLLADGRLDEHI